MTGLERLMQQNHALKEKMHILEIQLERAEAEKKSLQVVGAFFGILAGVLMVSMIGGAYFGL